MTDENLMLGGSVAWVVVGSVEVKYSRSGERIARRWVWDVLRGVGAFCSALLR